MASDHQVAKGECVSSIAFLHGFFAETIWDDPANAELRAERGSMNVLSPGDVVSIPDKREKELTGATGAAHRFRRKGVPAKLCLTILDSDTPMANRPYTITIDKRERTGTTDGDGGLAVSIPPDAREGHLVVGEGEEQREFTLQLGHLQPIDDVAGVQARLNNLGFECGDEAGTVGPMTEAALKAFQARSDLSVTGEIDEATRARLVELHDQS